MAAGAVRADDVVDQINITVPISCTMSGTGINTHNKEIQNGTYESNIGTTTLEAFCNDAEGFAIYATGYTGNEIGGTNSNKLVGTAASRNAVIETGTATSAGNPDVSNWAMKLTATQDSGDTTGTNAVTIDNSFNSYHTVPNEYMKVAHKNAVTDMTGSIGGVKLTTTYAAYISKTQAADTYTGQVKYTLVHPADAGAPVGNDQVGVMYDANGSTFSGGGTKNRTVYEQTCTTQYVGTTPSISKTPNVGNDGSASSGYQYDYTQTDPVTISGADRLKVEINYGIEAGYDYLYVFEGTYSGEVTGGLMDAGQIATLTGGNGSDETQFVAGESTTLYIDGDTVTFAFFGDDYEDDGYYGYYAEVYPIYATEHSGAVATEVCELNSTPVIGAYAQTTDWYGSWYGDINSQHYDFMSEAEVFSFLNENIATLGGTTVTLHRGLTFTEAYTRASKTQNGGYYVAQDLNEGMCHTIAITQNQTLKDNRDNNTYLVGKLKDGNCWMLDNLRLDPTDSTTAANMSSSNTNATTAAITNYLNGGSSTAGWSSVAVADVDSGFNSYTAPMINNASKDTLVTSYGPAATNGQAKVGIYYNYCAATVGTYCYEGGSGVDVPDTIIDAPYDICPANWRMPTGGGNGEYLALFNKYSTTMDATSSASLQHNLSTPLSGFFWNSSAYDQGNWGRWWSSTYYIGFDMYLLFVDSECVYPDYSNDRNVGYAMRCLVGD